MAERIRIERTLFAVMKNGNHFTMTTPMSHKSYTASGKAERTQMMSSFMQMGFKPSEARMLMIAEGTEHQTYGTGPTEIEEVTQSYAMTRVTKNRHSPIHPMAMSTDPAKRNKELLHNMRNG